MDKKRTTEVLIVDSAEQAIGLLLNKMKSQDKSSSRPLETFKLLNFSAYADLQMPREPPNEYRLRTENSRASWIMNLALSGPCDHVIWFHPPNIEPSLADRQTSDYYIGEDHFNLKYVCDIAEPYYFLQGGFCSSNHMKNKKRISLTSLPVHDFLTICPFCGDLTRMLLKKLFVVHIDQTIFLPEYELCQMNSIPAIDEILRLYAPPQINHLEIELSANISDTTFCEHALRLAQAMNEVRLQQLNQYKSITQDILTCQTSVLDFDPRISQEMVDISAILLYYLKLLQCTQNRDQIEIALVFTRALHLKALQYIAEMSISYVVSRKDDNDFPPQSSLQPATDAALMKNMAQKLHDCFVDISNPYLLPFADKRGEINEDYCEDKDMEAKQAPTMTQLRDSMESFLNHIHNPRLVILSRNSSEYSSSLAQLAQITGTCPSLGAYTTLNPRRLERNHAQNKCQNELIETLARIYGKECLAITLAYENSKFDRQYLQYNSYNARSIDLIKTVDGASGISNLLSAVVADMPSTNSPQQDISVKPLLDVDSKKI